MSQEYMDPELFADFIVEAKEHLETIEPNLLELEKAPGNLDLLNDIFRPMHSLKGASGFLGLNRINRLAHKAENILDELRKGTMIITPEIMDVILAATDALRQMIDNLEVSSSEGDVEIEPIYEQIDAIMRGETTSSAPAQVPAEPSGDAAPPTESGVENAAKGGDADGTPGMTSSEWIDSLSLRESYALTAFGEGHLKDFIDEAREITENLTSGLLNIERDGESDPELVNDLFRYFHNLKGNSGIIGYHELNSLTHEAETLLNRVRHNEMPATHELIDLLLLVVDVIDSLVDHIEPAKGGVQPFDISEMLSCLQQAVAGGPITLPAALMAQGPAGQDASEPEIAPEESIPSAPAEAAVAESATAVEADQDDVAAFVATVRQQQAIIRAALDELRKDGSGKEYIDALYRSLVAVQNASGFMKLEELKVYAERTAGLVNQGRSSDIDFSIMVDLLSQEVAIIDDMVEKEIDRLQAAVTTSGPLATGESSPTSTGIVVYGVAGAPAAESQEAQPAPAAQAAPAAKNGKGTKGGKSAAAAEAPVKSKTAVVAGEKKDVAPEKPAPSVQTSPAKAAPAAPAAPAAAAKAAAPATPAAPASPAAPKVEPASPAAPVAPKVTPAAAPSQPAAAGGAAPAKAGDGEHKSSSTIRVDHEKLDHLMNLIGELIINRNRYTMLARRLEEPGASSDIGEIAQDLSETTYAMARISDDLQDTIMKVRMVPVASVFSRFPRLVRDLSRKSGKEVDLVLEGEETELDKSVVEVIGDPLVHLIRNSVDHGVEPEAERLAKGKPVKGKVTLRAYHKGNSVAIEIEDDGRGLDPEKLREVAVRKGILSAEDAKLLDDREARELIFAPGFSSAEKITDISGRGVGMDVVRTNIKALKGSISINSEVGKGTRFTLSLPLTLAIIDALMINVAGEMYAIPLDAVSETTKIEASRLTDVKGRKAVTLRGEVLGIVQLAEMLGLPHKELPEVLSVVVIHDNDRRLGLVVDRLLERQEIVIKPLGSYLGDIRGISGATIMGDGSVILILDPHEMYVMATSNSRNSNS